MKPHELNRHDYVLYVGELRPDLKYMEFEVLNPCCSENGDPNRIQVRCRCSGMETSIHRNEVLLVERRLL